MTPLASVSNSIFHLFTRRFSFVAAFFASYRYPIPDNNEDDDGKLDSTPSQDRTE